MTNSILQHAPEDVKIAASFMQQQPLDPTLEARVEASGMAYMLLRRAERAEQALEVQTERASCYDDYLRSARRAFDAGAMHIYMDLDDGVESLINERDAANVRAEKAELTASNWEQSAADHRATVATQEAELAMIGAALGVAERQRKQAELERDQHARAITAWHLEAQRAQAETIKIGAKLRELSTAVVAALASDMDGEEEPHPDVAAIYTLAYAITQGE